MRIWAMTALLMLCLNAGAYAREAPANVWRLDVTNLEADRELIRACLRQGEDASCEAVVQRPCLEAAEPTGPTTVAMRQCYWRAIAAWEDEMQETLARLQAHVDGTRWRDIQDSQRAWEASMLADVGLVMDTYRGGSLSGVVGAHARAIATAQRALFLAGVLDMTDPH